MNGAVRDMKSGDEVMFVFSFHRTCKSESSRRMVHNAEAISRAEEGVLMKCEPRLTRIVRELGRESQEARLESVWATGTIGRIMGPTATTQSGREDMG